MIEKNTLSKPVYDSVKSMILNNELKPGEKVLQEHLANRLGISFVGRGSPRQEFSGRSPYFKPVDNYSPNLSHPSTEYSPPQSIEYTPCRT
jgi:DNA-binding transcriptional MocR family regulator